MFLQHTSASLILCENADPDARLALGTWQGLYLYERRHAGHARSVVVTLMGEGK